MEADIVWTLTGELTGEGFMPGASEDDSTSKVWALLGGIASALAILAWLGVSNAQELRELIADPSSSGSSSTPYKPSETVDIPDGTETSDVGTADPDPDDDFSGGSDEPESETPSPTPDPTEESFKTVSVGDCLEIYDTGRSVDSLDWSAAVPPAAVPCDRQGSGLVQVTSTTDATCPNDAGKASWIYRSAVSGETATLCVTRIYFAYYCILGKQVGDKTQLGSMTAVDCKAQQIPAAYNRIIHIIGVYQAPSNAGPRNCVQGAYDQTQYLTWLVNDGKTLLCGTIYRGG
ncbi:hypothetical protein ACIOJD_09475 [Streptomyces sp. NPDC088116]|uniref:hypothetical protein n=1 Tax=Streptomyces sp. NPDC088116 TaxID=3365825 RepID=UPI00380FEA8C